MSARWWTLLVLALASCARKSKPATLEDDLASIAPVEASFDQEPPRELDRIVVSTTEIRISGDPFRIARLPLAKDDVEGSLLLPLRLALDGRKGDAGDAGLKPPSRASLLQALVGTGVLVVADKRTPFSVLAPIVATAAATGIAPGVFLVVRGTKASALELHTAPVVHDKRGAPDLAPRVTIGERGVTVSIAGHAVARGCADEGPPATVTVPKTGTGNEHDVAALEACALSLSRAIGGEAGDAVFVTAAPETDLATLVRVIAAFRKSFHDVSLFSPGAS